MATIYRFIVEQKASANSSATSKATATKGAAKKGKSIPLFGGHKGGVEHNRKMRAINPILNKVTNGAWEKGTRLTRAAGGLFKTDAATGKLKLNIGGPAIAIIIAFILMTVWNTISRNQTHARQKAERANTNNFQKLENGSNAVHGAYRVANDLWSGRIRFNENK